jgi:hypothetical protein
MPQVADHRVRPRQWIIKEASPVAPIDFQGACHQVIAPQVLQVLGHA